MKRGSVVFICIELWFGLEFVDMLLFVKVGCGVCFVGIGVINNLV